MKVYTSIYKRIYRSLKKEYGLLFDLNAKHLDDRQYFTVMDSPEAVAKEDYDAKSFDVSPVADPNVVTDAQKMARAQIYLQVAQAPQVNGHEAMRRFFEAMGAEDIDAILPPPSGPSPADQLKMQEAAASTDEKKAKTEKATQEARRTGAEATIMENAAAKDQRVTEALDFSKELQNGLQMLMNPGPAAPTPERVQ